MMIMYMRSIEWRYFANVRFTSLLIQRIEDTNYFQTTCNSACPQHSLKFSFKLANTSRSYEENKTTPFSVHGVIGSP